MAHLVATGTMVAMGDGRDKKSISEESDASVRAPAPAFVPVWVPEDVLSPDRELSPSSLAEGLRRHARVIGRQSGSPADARLLHEAADALERLTEQVRFAGECLQAAQLTGVLREEDRIRLEAIATMFVEACRVDEFGAVFDAHDGDLAEAVRLWNLRTGALDVA